MSDSRPRGRTESDPSAQAVEEAQERAARGEPPVLIFVQCTPAYADRVGIWDVDKAHPGGEVFVAGPSGPVECAETGAILQAMRDGKIVRVTQGAAKKFADEKADTIKAIREAQREAPPMNALYLPPDPALVKRLETLEQASAKGEGVEK